MLTITVEVIEFQQLWKTQQWSKDWKRSVFFPTLKNSNAKECSNYCTVVLISHASKVILKIIQARLQQYVNQELPDVQAEFRKGRVIRNQIAKICLIIEKAGEFQEKKSTSASLIILKPFCTAQQNVENSERDGNSRPPDLPP